MEIFRQIREKAAVAFGREPQSQFGLPPELVTEQQRRSYSFFREQNRKIARAGGVSSTLEFWGALGDPDFDSLPDILRESPKDKAYIFTIVTKPGWEEDGALRAKIDEILRKAQERGNTVIKIDIYKRGEAK